MQEEYARYRVMHYTIKLGVDPEPIWARIQAHDAWIRFNAFGQVVFMIDERNPIHSLFVIGYMDSVDRVEQEEWIA